MLPHRGLLYRPLDRRWYHVSTSKATAKLRPLDGETPEQVYSRENDDDQLQSFVAGADLYSIGRIAAELAPHADFPAGGYPHTAASSWREVASLLEELRGNGKPAAVQLAPQTVPGTQPAAAKIIPVTRLRRFYETLRLINTAPVHGAMAAHIGKDSDRADILDTLFGASLAHLRRYSNSDQPFHSMNGRDWYDKYRSRPKQFAYCLASRLAPGDDGPALIDLAGSGNRPYRVVSYDVSPLRAAGGWMFDDGRPGSSSGQGGMDLLLAAPDGAPVIGEVKATGDTSLFFALVQALMYASELVGEPQAARLQLTYPQYFSGEVTPCEILILVETDEPRWHEETLKIIKFLMGKDGGTIAKHVRRITVAEASFDGEHPRFRLLQSVESSYQLPSVSGRTGGSKNEAAASGADV